MSCPEPINAEESSARAIRRWRRACWLAGAAGLVPVLALMSWAAWYHGDPLSPPRDGLGFSRHFIHYGVYRGWTAGRPSGAGSWVPALQPGDVVLCRNPEAVYGRWSHVTLVLPDGRVLAQDLLRGMGTGAASDLGVYDELRVLRLGTPAQRALAAQAGASYVGTVFNLLAHRDDPRQWSCARVVAAAWRSAGIELIDDRCWVTPDAIAVPTPETP